jgi:GNAT superfamily N-acetyltransferase
MTTQHLTVHPPLAPGLQIGVMTPEEIATLAQWARLEGWNPGHHDLNIAAGYDPEAFIALRQDGALVGGGSILSWRGAAGFMGLFILRPDARGRGWGGQLWHARLQRLRARLSPGAPIGMDGVKAMAPFYARGGFRPLHEDWRYAGCAQGERDPQMISIEQVPMLQLDAFDRLHVTAPRGRFLRDWLHPPGANGLALMEDGRVTAMGLVRPCHEGFKVGPAFAEEAGRGERLLASLLGLIPGQPVQVDIPEPHTAAARILERLGLRPTFSCVRMVQGDDRPLPLTRIFGLTSFEFG